MAAELEELWSRLLGDEYGAERAAFLFTRRAHDGHTFDLIDILYPEDAELADQHSGSLELREGLLNDLIRRAHEMEAALVEVHSHPFDRSERVRFSDIDTDGLGETAPHVVWRLPGRPYMAFVFGKRKFDSLYWGERVARPSGVVAIIAGSDLHQPTGLTLADWR